MWILFYLHGEDSIVFELGQPPPWWVPWRPRESTAGHDAGSTRCDPRAAWCPPPGRRPTLVHGQAESLVGHLLELSVLKAKPADVRDLLVRAGRNWFRQHRIDQLETENLVWFAILRKNSIHLNKVEKILLIQKLSQYAMLMLYYTMDPQPRISTKFWIY